MSRDVVYQSRGALIQFIETNLGTVTATAFVGDGSLLQNVTGSGGGGGGISWDGSTANGVATYKDADEATVEANLTFDGSTLLLSDDAAKLQVLDTNGGNHAVTLLPGAGPKVQFGDTDSSDGSLMEIGSYNSINNIDTQTRDFHLYGTNTTTGLYFDESAGTFGIGTTAPQVELHISDAGSPQIRLSDPGASDTQDVVAYTEYYKGDNTTRIGWCGYGSTTNEHFTINNQTATGSFEVKTNNTTAFTVDYQGNATVVGDLTVTGNDIKGSGGTAITMDGSNNVSVAADLTASADLLVSGGDITLGDSGSPATTYIRDSGGDARISLTNAGGVILRDLSGDAEFSVNNGFAYVYGYLQVGGDIKNSAGLTTTTMNSDGSITNPLQPMVYAFRNSTQDLSPDTSWETVIFNDESTTNDTAFDVGGDYNTSTGYFTAPADGKYLISAEVMLSNIPSVADPTAPYILLKCITTNSAADGIVQYSGRQNPAMFSGSADYNYLQVPGTWLASMDDGDTAYVQVVCTAADSGTKIYGASTATYTRIQIMKVA